MTEVLGEWICLVVWEIRRSWLSTVRPFSLPADSTSNLNAPITGKTGLGLLLLWEQHKWG